MPTVDHLRLGVIEPTHSLLSPGASERLAILDDEGCGFNRSGQG
jgi:hypothetical protein